MECTSEGFWIIDHSLLVWLTSSPVELLLLIGEGITTGKSRFSKRLDFGHEARVKLKFDESLLSGH